LPRLKVVKEVTAIIKFHHWELVFVEVFKENGGFDLLVGNPPWVQVKWEEKAILSDYYPKLSLRNIKANEIVYMRSELLKTNLKNAYYHEFEELTGSKNFLTGYHNYPLMQKMKNNLYKCFITQTLSLALCAREQNRMCREA